MCLCARAYYRIVLVLSWVIWLRQDTFSVSLHTPSDVTYSSLGHRVVRTIAVTTRTLNDVSYLSESLSSKDNLCGASIHWPSDVLFSPRSLSSHNDLSGTHTRVQWSIVHASVTQSSQRRIFCLGSKDLSHMAQLRTEIWIIFTRTSWGGLDCVYFLG